MRLFPGQVSGCIIALSAGVLSCTAPQHESTSADHLHTNNAVDPQVNDAGVCVDPQFKNSSVTVDSESKDASVYIDTDASENGEAVPFPDPLDGYAIVVSQETAASEWKAVVDNLQLKYPKARVYTYVTSIEEVKPALQANFPNYVCFVNRPPVPDTFIRDQVIPFMRTLDEDPYEDAIWTVLTGYDLQDALRIANAAPLVISRGVSHAGSGWLNWFESGVSWSEGVQFDKYVKEPGALVTKVTGPADTTEEMSQEVNTDTDQCISTSGHASEHNWVMGYTYTSGTMFSKAGQVTARDAHGKEYPITTSNPKIYYSPGNCLIARQVDMDSMSLAWIHSGVNAFFGHVDTQTRDCVAWEVAKFFFALQDRYTFAEAVYLARQAAMAHPHGWPRCLGITLLYGDPAWNVRMKPSTDALYAQNLSVRSKGNNVYEFTFSFKMNTRSTLWLTESAIAYLPFRVKNHQLISNSAEFYTFADNFVLMRQTGTLEKDTEHTIVFEAESLSP
jgi:hypothetical protein